MTSAGPIGPHRRIEDKVYGMPGYETVWVE
jgi:hypothetical protein